MPRTYATRNNAHPARKEKSTALCTEKLISRRYVSFSLLSFVTIITSSCIHFYTFPTLYAPHFDNKNTRVQVCYT